MYDDDTRAPLTASAEPPAERSGKDSNMAFEAFASGVIEGAIWLVIGVLRAIAAALALVLSSCG